MDTLLRNAYHKSTLFAIVKTECQLLVQYSQLKVLSHQAGLKSSHIYRTSELRSRYTGQTHKVCHIIGSGSSVLQSTKSIMGANSFVIGLNQSALLPLDYDIYFIEVATSIGEHGPYGIRQAALVNNRIDQQKTDVYYKCLWDPTWWDSDFLEHAFNHPIGIVQDLIPDFPLLLRSQNIKRAATFVSTRRRSNFLINVGSSVVFSILFAYQMGFSSIVVHGLDFIGPHFFHDIQFNEYEDILEIRSHDSVRPAVALHAAGNWNSFVLPSILHALASRGCTVYSSSSSSLFSTYSPVYIG